MYVSCTRGDCGDVRSPVSKLTSVVHRSVPKCRVRKVCDRITSLDTASRSAVGIPTGNSSTASKRTDCAGEGSTSSKTKNSGAVGSDLAATVAVGDRLRCSIAEGSAATVDVRAKTAYALLERWDYDYHTFMSTVRMSQPFKKTKPNPKDQAWRNWDCDDFPKERLCYLVLNELASQLKDSALRERWKLAVKLISDPCEWQWVDKEAKEAIYAEHRRAKPNPCLERYVDKLLEAGILTHRARDRIKVFLSAFLIPKISKQRVRIIVNAIPTNELLVAIPKVVLPGMQTVDELVLANDFFVEYDGHSYYNQFGLGEAVRDFFGLRIGKQNYVWSTGPMGWAPMVFIGQCATEILCADDKDGTDVSKLVYIDNCMFWGKASKEKEVQDSQRRFEARCAKANAKFSVTKKAGPTGDVLGLFVDCEKKTVRLQDKFVKKLIELKSNMACVFNEGVEGVTHRDIWKLFGSIMWGARILRIRYHSYPDFWFWIRRRAGYLTRFPELWDKPCKMPRNAIEDVKRLIEKMIENEPYCLLKHKPDASIDLYVDASGVGVGACIPSAEAIMSDHLPRVKTKVSIAYYELYALVHGLKWARRRFPEVKNWSVFTDNTNVEAWVRKGVGPTYIHTKLLKELDSLGAFTLHRIASASNFADKPSRVVVAQRLA